MSSSRTVLIHVSFSTVETSSLSSSVGYARIQRGFKPSAHTHTLFGSEPLSGRTLFAIGFTFDFEFKNSSNFHGVVRSCGKLAQ